MTELSLPTSPEEQETLTACIAKCEELRTALLTDDPDMMGYLRQINEQMRQFPELVHMLTDEQIAPVYQAMMKRTGIAISVTKSKSKKSSGLLEDGRSLGDVL